ncbi:HAMP domain-containing histidine kinase [Clostridium sp. CM027]|uniref:sensor histidine kinase n=1 Tax=Clostridium sp. CM027 TaxID=2849865 RepID=UPI001C6E3F0F|nr:HAMP domain-containing sensor histidine kinase [Clostridium sp. CM027]MBW9146348.1 HAMP domain-containing histidine kinase [Clostridium sp. CM027]UVE39860.1 HAMP domain-containing histidine kinase [Clostridium sp. CM027]
MQRIIIILLLAAVVISVTLYVFLYSEIKSINNQLNKINKTKTSSKILLSYDNKQLHGLALGINKNLEEKQKSEAKYKKMDLELRKAISNISHDLRTPLTSIMGYMQLIDNNSLSEDENKKYIDIVKNRTKSLESLITSFYDLSRLEGNEYKFDMKSLNLNNILCECVASFYNDFLNCEVEPKIDIEEKPYFIIGDEVEVKRVFSNLIQNIIKYGEGYAAISLKRSNEYIVTIFQNAAQNLSDEDAKRLFERFFTADRARTGKSTGIGLAITKQLVEQMGHEISVELVEGNLSIIIRWKCLKSITE